MKPVSGGSVEIDEKGAVKQRQITKGHSRPAPKIPEAKDKTPKKSTITKEPEVKDDKRA